MTLFSQRIGKKSIKSIIQTDSIDEDLKVALWNALTIFYWEILIYHNSIKRNKSETEVLLSRIWIHFLRFRLDKMPATFDQMKLKLEEFYFNAEWFEIYDLIEFVPSNYTPETENSLNQQYYDYCNTILQKELSAYRFINGKLTPISAREEVESIEEAINIDDLHIPVKTHLNRALELFADRHSPDYRNSIKESISAVESYCKILLANQKTTLGQALKQIEDRYQIHPALTSAFSSLYGYTSDADGIRHGLKDPEKSNQEEAKFMLVSCSAFINYLKQKESKTPK